MVQMAFVSWALLLFLAKLHSLAASSSHADGNLTHHSPPSLCLPDQANALLKLKQSFLFDSYSITTLPSWQAETDCCLWEGVGCSNLSGHVIALNFSGFGLRSLGIDPVLFNLTSLRLLDLSMNSFYDAEYGIPSVIGLDRLTLLTHLNLSNSGISGQIPTGINKLTNLISLDVSTYGYKYEYVYSCGGYPCSGGDLWEDYFPTVVANLNNLRELKLDGVGIAARAEDCFKALAKSVPCLRVLSLEGCSLQGHIDQSLSRLYFLEDINLSYNDGMNPGPFPEFFMHFLNLIVLQLAGTNLEGWFPRTIFQSKDLRVLDLSGNLNLSGSMPKFSRAGSLQILKLHMTNFSYVESSYFSNFESLMELGLDGKLISMDFHTTFGMRQSLRSLVLTRLHLLRELEQIENIKNLTSLRILKVSRSNFTTETLSLVANLNNLKRFSIFECDSLGQLPSAIGNMSNLESLDIFDCEMYGPIPREVGAINKLTSLRLTSTGLSGRIPSSIVNLTRLTHLELDDNYLSGEIPSSIGDLTQLIQLSLCSNCLTGEIPSSLFTLPVVQILDLSTNQLSGPIHEFDMASSHLEEVTLGMNELVGQIPRSLLALKNLRSLDIGFNNLMGLVDLASLWRLKNLVFLGLSYNKLSVTDVEGTNSSATYLSWLQGLELASCNITKIPNLLTRLNHMVSLDLSNNKISGKIPKFIWERWNGSLMSLNLSHNMFTGMELTSYVIPSIMFYIFDLSYNKLQGQIPMPSSSAEFYDFSNNAFSSVLPNFTLYLNVTGYLSMSNNSISGYLPHSICDSPPDVLDLSYNNFRGPVPPCLIEHGSINVLNLRENQFEGALPSNISSGCSFNVIDLHGNKIKGQLPRALYNCTDLVVLDLGRNQIADTFPYWLGTLLNLRVLILRSNKFNGSIGYLKDERSGELFRSLQIVDLASNNFSGILPPGWFETLKSMEKSNNTGEIIRQPTLRYGGFYKDIVSVSYKGLYAPFGTILTTFSAIDLSDNALEGIIPASIGKLVSLHVLNLSQNAFTGEIPPQLGGMTAMESLDLSSNMLSGEIPQELTNLTFLSILNLSNNQLEGKIPRSRQFATFQSSSFDGNEGLCGLPLSIQCGTPDSPNDIHMASSSGSIDIVLFLFVGVGFGIGFAAAILVRPSWIKKWFCHVNLTNMI